MTLPASPKTQVIASSIGLWVVWILPCSHFLNLFSVLYPHCHWEALSFHHLCHEPLHRPRVSSQAPLPTVCPSSVCLSYTQICLFKIQVWWCPFPLYNVHGLLVDDVALHLIFNLHFPSLPWWLRWESICLQCGRPEFNPCVRQILWRRKWQPTPVLLPGKIPWTEEPGGLQSMGLQRVGHDCVTKLSNFSHLFP